MEPHSRPLPYWLFFITGFLIAAYAAFIKNSGDYVNQNAMTLFIYVGLIFIAIGLVKWAMQSLSKKEKKVAQQLAGIDDIDYMERKINSRNKPKPNTINPSIYCNRCGARNPATAYYCSSCGNSLRQNN